MALVMIIRLYTGKYVRIHLYLQINADNTEKKGKNLGARDPSPMRFSRAHNDVILWKGAIAFHCYKNGLLKTMTSYLDISLQL